jgi:ornithine carbamoyltransferase
MLMQTLDSQTVAAFRGKDFLTIADWTPAQLRALINLAIDLKQKQKAGIPHRYLEGKTLGMIFEKSSTRTRVSFEVGIYQLGGIGLFLSKNDLQIGRGETIHDTAKTLSGMLDAIMIRTFAHQTCVDLAAHATIPVINGLTDLAHPCQALADYQTILETKGRLHDLKIAYIGDPNNVTNSLLMGAAKLGLHFTMGAPSGYPVNPAVWQKAKAVAAETGALLEIYEDPREAVVGADVIYTDVWTSMGQEAESEIRLKAFQGYQVNDNLVRYARPDYSFMHCLPAHRGEEVSASVIDGPHSIVFEEAENRLHAQKALMVAVMQGENAYHG